MALEVTKLSIDEWISLTQSSERPTIPITLHTTSGSMIPTVRMHKDAVVVIPCTPAEVQVGDIVLLRNPGSEAGVLLHRLYRIGDGKLITLGDNMRRPDRERDTDLLLGRAVSITGPGKKIDCDSQWRRLQGKAIVYTLRLRPVLFFARRVLRKLYRIAQHA